ALVEEFVKEHTAAEACDTMFLPALLSAANDQKNGDLSKDDQGSITDAVREIFQDTVASQEAETHAESAADGAGARILVVELPFHDETDELVVDMLRSTSAHGRWSAATAKDIQSAEGEEPTLVLLGTSR